MKISAVGIPWYSEADYNDLRELFEDGDKLPITYKEWLQAANGILETIKGSGAIPVKAHLAPEEFSAWCAARHLHINAHARMEFANEVAARTYLDQS